MWLSDSKDLGRRSLPARRRGRLVADQFRAAGRAVVSAHVGRVAPPAGSSIRTAGSSGSSARCRRSSSCSRFGRSRLLMCLSIRRRCALILVRIQRFDFLCSVSAAAVFTFQFPDIPVKFQRPCAGRALINCDLLRSGCRNHIDALKLPQICKNMPKYAKHASMARKHKEGGAQQSLYARRKH